VSEENKSAVTDVCGKYKGKLFSVLGDSISTLGGYTVPEEAAFYEGMTKFDADVFLPEDTWWGMVVQALGGEILVNNSFSGSTVCRKRGCEIPSYGCSDERTSSLSRSGVEPDVVIVYMGTNDWGCAIAPTPADLKAEGRPIFSSAYADMISKLKRNYPNAEIWCLTLGVSRYGRDESYTFPYTYGGRHIEEYCSVIRKCAAEHGCRLVDLYAETSADPFDTFDRFHPNADGMKRVSEAVLAQLRRCLVQAE